MTIRAEITPANQTLNPHILMKKYNVGIIGHGWVATAHIPAINESKQAQVTAIYSSRPLDAAALSTKYGSPVTTYTDLNAMLANPDIHAVSICSYPYQHAAHVIAAAKAGKQIIIEKPSPCRGKTASPSRPR